MSRMSRRTVATDETHIASTLAVLGTALKAADALLGATDGSNVLEPVDTELREKIETFSTEGKRLNGRLSTYASDLRNLETRMYPSPILVVLVAVILVAVSGTVAWLTTKRDHQVSTPPTSSVVAPDSTSALARPLSLASADLRGIRLVNLDLSGVDFSNACLMNSVFVDVALDGALLKGADLRGVQFIGTDVSVANGDFFVDQRSDLGTSQMPSNALTVDGSQTLPCDVAN